MYRLLPLFLLFTFATFLSQSTKKDEEVNIQEVVVTATKTPKKLKDTPITVQVITSEDIKKSQSNNFQSFLENEFSGINFSYEGGSPKINMMGFGGKYILFLVDGERMAGETFDNIDYDRINIDNIERIEIIKGASSSLYGSNAIGGVINIITKKPNRKREISTGYQYDTQKDNKIHFNLGSKKRWGSINISSFYKHRQPFIIKDKEPFITYYTDGEISKSALGKLNVAGFTNYGVTPRINFNINDKITLELTPSYYFNERNRGDDVSDIVRDRYYNYTGNLKGNFNVSKDKKLSTSIFYDKYDKYKYYRKIHKKEKDYENEILRIATQYNQTIWDKHSLVAGGELLYDNLLSFMFDGSGYESNGIKKNAQSLSLFTQQEWAINPKFTLVTGGRLDYHSIFKEYFTFRFSGMYRANHFTFRGGYSSGFRSPTLKELYTDWFHPWGGGFHIMGSELLKPETSNNFNASAEFNKKKLNITFITQYSRVKDKINTIWNKSNDTIRYENFNGNTNIISTELSASYRIKRFRFRGSYSFYDIQQRLSDSRPHTLTFKVEYQPQKQYYLPNIILSGKYLSSSTLYGEAADGRTYRSFYPAYTMWRLQTNINFPYGFTTNIGINNLFDYQVKTTSFYSPITMGRTYYFGINWNL